MKLTIENIIMVFESTAFHLGGLINKAVNISFYIPKNKDIFYSITEFWNNILYQNKLDFIEISNQDIAVIRAMYFMKICEFLNVPIVYQKIAPIECKIYLESSWFLVNVLDLSFNLIA